MRRNVRSIPVTTPGGEVLLLAVPAMHGRTPSSVRVQVFEYVLRRQIGLAQMLAEITDEEVTGQAPELARLRSLLQETPHRNSRGAIAA